MRATRSTQRQVYRKRAISCWGFCHAGRRGGDDGPRRAPPCYSTLVKRACIPKNCPVMRCCGVAVVCPQSGGRVGAPASAPVGAHPAQGLWWGLASRPAARTAAFAPQSGATGQGGPSPRVGWVDLPGAYAPGGGLQGSSQKVTCTDERGPCPSVRWRQGRESKHAAAMGGHRGYGDCRSDVGGPRCAIPSPARLPDGRPLGAAAGRLWCAYVAPCGTGAAGGPRLGASTRAPWWWL